MPLPLSELTASAGSKASKPICSPVIEGGSREHNGLEAICWLELMTAFSVCTFLVQWNSCRPTMETLKKLKSFDSIPFYPPLLALLSFWSKPYIAVAIFNRHSEDSGEDFSPKIANTLFNLEFNQLYQLAVWVLLICNLLSPNTRKQCAGRVAACCKCYEFTRNLCATQILTVSDTAFICRRLCQYSHDFY